MKLRSMIRHTVHFLLSQVNRAHLLEYWQIKRNELLVLPPILNFYKGFVWPGMKIIDVGANVGTYSRAFIELGADVIGMEPQKYCQDILKVRFKNSSKFRLIPAAAGSGNMKGEIQKSHSHTIASMNPQWIRTVKESKRFSGENWVEKEEITITTLDAVINEGFLPDYVKIDVEGFEKHVLMGLHHPIDFISFEITLPEMVNSAIDCIHEINRIGKYVFALPNQNISEIVNWKTSADIVSQLQLLSESSEKTSSDVFCKKVSDF